MLQTLERSWNHIKRLDSPTPLSLPPVTLFDDREQLESWLCRHWGHYRHRRDWSRSQRPNANGYWELHS